MSVNRAWASRIVLGALAVAAVVGTPALASGFIEWNPQTGFYWTEQAQAGAAVRLSGDDDTFLEVLFQVLQQMSPEEQRQLALQLRAQAPGEQGTVVVDAAKAIDLMDARKAEAIRNRLAIEEQAQNQDGHDDSNDGNRQEGLHEPSQNPTRERSRTELKERHEEQSGQQQKPSIGSQSGQSGSHDDGDDGDGQHGNHDDGEAKDHHDDSD